MKKNRLLFAIILMVFAALQQAAAAKKGAPKEPAPKLSASNSKDLLVIEALGQAGYQLTPETKASFFANQKAKALEEIAKTGQILPKDFLDWVDSDEEVAATVYGIERNAAQRLVLLRSLELDLGAEEVREKHKQFVLAVMNAHADKVQPETLSNPDLGISLQQRGLLKLNIEDTAPKRVNTRPTDRPLDLNDHIINFFEENPVVEKKTVVTYVDGEKIETEKDVSRPTYAYEVMKHVKLQEKFNAYMKAHGQDVSIDCGENLIKPGHWGGGKDIGKAFSMFLAAYQEKGLLPKQPDPAATPGELAAYVIRNDNYRFPDYMKRSWPAFPLDAPWPVLDMLAKDTRSLRIREYAWNRYCETGSLPGYCNYIGKIAQYPSIVKARNLQPFDYAYNTYPMKIKDGGVCGTASSISKFSHIARGVPAAQASQPGHSCLVVVTGNIEKGFGLRIGQSVSSPQRTSVSGYGRYLDAVAKFSMYNYGLMPYLNSRVSFLLNEMLPEDTAVEKRLALLKSGLDANPYNLEVATQIQQLLPTPGQQIEFFNGLEKTLAAVEKPGCAKTGHYNSRIQANLDKRLLELPLSTDKADVMKVVSFLSNRSDEVWLKYQLGVYGLADTLDRLIADIKTSLEGTRTRESCDLLSKRIALAGGAIKDAKEKSAWATEVLPLFKDKEFYTARAGKRNREYMDASIVVLRNLIGNTPDVRANFEKSLTSHVEGTRSPQGCDLMCKRLKAITDQMRNRKERSQWGDTLLGIITGHEIYAPADAPTSFRLDPLVKEIYAMGCDLSPAHQQMQEDLKANVDGELSERTKASQNLLTQRLGLLRKYTPKGDRKEFGETLFSIINGHEFYLYDPKKRPELIIIDPVVNEIYAFGCDISVTKEKLFQDLKEAIAGERSSNLQSYLAQRLSLLRRYTPGGERKEIGETLLGIISGHESYVPNPKYPNAVAVDPVVNEIYAFGCDISVTEEKLFQDLKEAIAGQRTTEMQKYLAVRLSLLRKYTPKGDRKEVGEVLLGIISGHESYVPNPKYPNAVAVDPIVNEIYAFGCDVSVTEEKLFQDLKEAIAGQRTTEMQKYLAVRLSLLRKYTPKGDRKEIGEVLLGIISGHESYASDPKRPTVMALDPVVPEIYAFGPDLSAPKARLVKDLETAVAGKRTAESTAILAQRLVALINAHPKGERKAWAQELLPVIAGHESYMGIDAKTQATREVEDPCAVHIYRNLGKKMPAPIKAATD